MRDEFYLDFGKIKIYYIKKIRRKKIEKTERKKKVEINVGRDVDGFFFSILFLAKIDDIRGVLMSD